MSSEGRVVILGGHGKTALLTAPRLVAEGFTVDSVIRNPAQSDDVEETGASAVLLDIEKASTEELAGQFDGAAAVIFSAGAGGGDPERTKAVDYESAVRAVDAAVQVGVPRFFMVSYATVNLDPGRVAPNDSFYPYVMAKHGADAHLRDSGLDFTILGPGTLTMESASKKLTIADADGRVDGLEPAREPGKNDTSRDNIAAVIAHALARDVAHRSTVNFYDGDTPLEDAVR
ncbi:MAG: NAD(P)H-binding protein [Mycobacteriaceae bacterium]|uniref:NAD(P)H-binding protein n=1 Tax=Corynebacterium sp. TaxID=1720 RepID=UPI003F98AC60